MVAVVVPVSANNEGGGSPARASSTATRVPAVQGYQLPCSMAPLRCHPSPYTLLQDSAAAHADSSRGLHRLAAWRSSAFVACAQLSIFPHCAPHVASVALEKKCCLDRRNPHRRRADVMVVDADENGGAGGQGVATGERDGREVAAAVDVTRDGLGDRGMLAETLSAHCPLSSRIFLFIVRCGS